jgi:hypothetical protein
MLRYNKEYHVQITDTSFIVNLDFEAIKLPPVTDILILGKKVPQGKMGVLHSFHLIAPDVFELIEVNNNQNVEAIIVNKNILNKLDKAQVIAILTEYVFPFISKGESTRVNFNVQIFQKNIKGEIHASKILPSEE